MSGQASRSAGTVVDALEARLRQLGVQRVYGEPLGELRHVPVSDPDLAVLLADADGRIGHSDGSGRLGAALLSGSILHLSSEPGGTANPQRITTAEELFDALVEPPGLEIPGTSALVLDLDLNEPFDVDASLRSPDRPPVVTLDPSMASLRIVLVAGPGVIRAGRLAELRELARRGGWGIINTWGARGAERWDSPFNFGTAGLQDRDLELAGLNDADVIISTGLDEDELPTTWSDSKLVQEVPPRQLGALISTWTANRNLPERPEHHNISSSVLAELYESDSVPLSGPRAALHLAGAIPDDGIVVADPGAAGFWVARSFPTSVPESLCVPATFTPGFAAAAALVCSLENRPCIAVTDQGGSAADPTSDPVDDTTAAMLELAEDLNASIGLQLWGDRGDLRSSSDHVDLTRSGLESPGITLKDVPVATSDIDAIVAALGEIIAWTEAE